VYVADSTTPRVHVTCTAPWGTCGLSQQLVPIPASAQPSPGSDGAMVVIDPAAGKSYEFWQAQRTASGWSASWGGVVDLNGTGTPGSAVGAGVSRLAGVVRAQEMADGRIDHALVFSTAASCQGVFRYPATKTDASTSGPGCIPEGTRVQLDPSIDVAAIPGITPGEVTIARALQKYGAYAVDTGGAAMAFPFERAASAGLDPYTSAGLSWDYFKMSHIPWGRVRVLAHWDAS